MDYIYHYTSVESLLGLLNDPEEEKKMDPEDRQENPDYAYCLYFHASDLRFMNDKHENQLIDKVKKCVPYELSLAGGIADWTQGTPHVISFCKKKDFIPMWKIYADKGNGICLKFKRDGLEDTIEKINHTSFAYISLKDCEYLTENAFKKRVRLVKNQLKEFAGKLTPGPIRPEQRDLPDFKSESAFLKLDCFEYEQETRLVVFASFDSRTKYGKYGISLYYPIKIPLRFLEEIMVGPSSNQDLLEHSIGGLLKSKGYDNLERYGINIKVTKSHIELR